MKRFLTSVALLFLAISLYGQSECMSTWPYLYPDFTVGTLYMRDGKVYERELNIHASKGRLHFIDGGTIKEANTGDIVLVELNGDKFTVLEGNVVKVVGDLDKGYVAVRTSIDFQKLNETDGPYGTKIDASSTLSVTTFDLTGVASSYSDLLRNRNEGTVLPLKNDYYIVAGGKVYNASKKGIENNLDAAGKAAFKAYQKNNKIKWQDSQSLLLLVDFINQL